MRIDIVTLFPEIFESFLETSILGRAQKGGLVTANAVNLRQYSKDKHRSVDEPPYGGGGGMVLGPQAIFDAVNALRGEDTSIILLTPQGRKFTQKFAEELAKSKHLLLICGHYEGVDERVRQHLATDEISIGDFVLTGGEVAAMVVIDAVVRLIPGVLGNEDSAAEDSFTMGLLEYPQYTRPRDYRGLSVPDVLLSGHHAEIDTWRKKEALKRTLKRRVDLFNDYNFSERDRKLIREVVAEELEAIK